MLKMEITDFKWWRLLLVPYLYLILKIYGTWFVEGADTYTLFEIVRRSFSLFAASTCLLFVFGAKFLTRNFWKAVFLLMVLDELLAIFVTNPEASLDIYLVLFPLFAMMFYYAFYANSIWKSN